ncbi:hypothetical protein KAI04_04030 [Candidatus Pacearchaeota archaeon]|nr:hypothetical protein [Candidatus Pacearchaeota archaeon]
MISDLWEKYKEKQVRLIIMDGNKIYPRDGIFKDIDDFHIFLKIEGKSKPIPFSRNTIKRVEIRE